MYCTYLCLCTCFLLGFIGTFQSSYAQTAPEPVTSAWKDVSRTHGFLQIKGTLVAAGRRPRPIRLSPPHGLNDQVSIDHRANDADEVGIAGQGHVQSQTNVGCHRRQEVCSSKIQRILKPAGWEHLKPFADIQFVFPFQPSGEIDKTGTKKLLNWTKGYWTSSNFRISYFFASS